MSPAQGAAAASLVLVIDIGNSGAKLGAVRGDDVAGPVRLPAADAKSVRALAEPMLKGQQALVAVCGSNPDKAKDLAWELARARLGETVAIDTRHAGVPWPKVAHPERAGMDRRVQCLAARHLAGGPAAVVSCGTAITVDLCDGEGALCGGAILPGLTLGMKALAAGTALLPEVALEGQVAMPALDTETAIRTGLVLGAAGAVERLLATSGVAEGLPLYVTGQDAKLLAAHLARTHRLHPGLGLLGIALAAQQRR